MSLQRASVLVSASSPSPLAFLADALEEADRARSVDVFAALGYVPTPKQAEFHAATEFDVFYGGAAGGGKTKALVMDALRNCVRWPGIRIGIFRRSYPELEESVVAELATVGFGQVQLGAKWNGTRHELTFANGSLLMCRYAATVEDFTKRQGGQYQAVYVDERTLMRPDVVDLLASRIRSGRRDVPVIGIRGAGNPGGAGHAAMKARYVEATEHGTKTYVDPEGRTVRFIPARLDDNPHLNAEYERQLNALPTAMRKAFRDGDWESFLGQVFDEWRRDLHVVPRFRVPKEWRRVAGIDWGYSAPWAVLWAAVDPDGRVWLYRERYETKVGETEQARRILADEAALDEHPARYADPSMWRSTGEGLPIADTYAMAGCALVPANNERLAGWQRVHHYLADGAACIMHRRAGLERCPMLHVLDGTCPDLVRTLPALPYDRLHVEDVDTDAEDHSADALRYLLMGIGGGSSIVDWDDVAAKGLDGSALAVPLGPTLAIDPAHTFDAVVTRVDSPDGDDDPLY